MLDVSSFLWRNKQLAMSFTVVYIYICIHIYIYINNRATTYLYVSLFSHVVFFWGGKRPTKTYAVTDLLAAPPAPYTKPQDLDPPSSPSSGSDPGRCSAWPGVSCIPCLQGLAWACKNTYIYIYIMQAPTKHEQHQKRGKNKNKTKTWQQQ